jgi:hypothetical protein
MAFLSKAAGNTPALVQASVSEELKKPVVLTLPKGK